eukprot:Lankesteria_metandrocarpae@DN5481_c0_g1_i2.p1
MINVSSLLFLIGGIGLFAELLLNSVDWKIVIESLKKLCVAVRLRIRWLSIICMLVAVLSKLGLQGLLTIGHQMLEQTPGVNLAVAIVPTTNNNTLFVVGSIVLVVLVVLLWLIREVVLVRNNNHVTPIGFVSVDALERLLVETQEMLKETQGMLEKRSIPIFQVDEAKPAGEANQKRHRMESTPTSDANIDRTVVNNSVDKAFLEMAACKHCGEGWRHPKRECAMKNARCLKCYQLGHVAKVCSNFVVTDRTGRVQTRIENKPGSTTVMHRRDRTTGDRLTTAEAVIKHMQDLAKSKARKAQGAKKTEKNDKATPAVESSTDMTDDDVVPTVESVEKDPVLAAAIDQVTTWWADMVDTDNESTSSVH